MTKNRSSGAGVNAPTEKAAAPRADGTSRKRGRPRTGEKPDRPWLKAGVSERTWYRQQKAARDRNAAGGK